MKKIILSALALSFLIACTQKDEEKPTISLSKPTQDQEYKQGETIELIATFKDNDLLSQAKIDIHYAGDGHSHGKMANTDVEWEYSETIDLDGSDETKELSISIPDNAEVGEYDIIIECTDLAGNEADFVEREFHIELK